MGTLGCDWITNCCKRDTILPESRTIHVNSSSPSEQEEGKLFESNYVSTTKYTWWNFVPKNLWEQFHRVANIYFLAVAVITMIPAISPVQGGPNAAALVFVLLVTAVKEGWEDFKRFRSDRELNKANVEVFRAGVLNTVRWRDLQVGDIVRIENNSIFPADLLLLSSSDEQGVAFIETANLDGETNLKFRQSLTETTPLNTVESLSRFSCTIHCESPNPQLHKFSGMVKIPSPDGGVVEKSLSLKQVLMRGCVLRNTHFLFGVVLYGGHQTKYMLNTQDPPHKVSTVEIFMNKFILRMILVQALLCVVSAVIGGAWQARWGEDHWYLSNSENIPFLIFKNFFTFFVLYSNFIPISLYVTLEIVRVCQAFFLMSDRQMYHPPCKMYAIARTSNLNEELGQVEHIFSDKTGTLTQNQMVFRSCTVGGEQFGNLLSVNTTTPFETEKMREQIRALVSLKPQLSPLLDEFWILNALCHTVNIEKDAEGVIKYQASSPDEATLVESAAQLGFVFVNRTMEGVTIAAGGSQTFFQILHVLEFESTRKRMSVIVRDQRDHKIKMFIKGADTMIRKNLSPNQDQELVGLTFKHLDTFANHGLRTLAMGFKVIDENEYAQWRPLYETAINDLTDKHDALVSEAAEMIERDLILLGGTGVEDRLQEGVPDTIRILIEAGIKLWVLTGDKEGTAIIIGRSCSLLQPDMEVLRINEANSPNDGAVADTITKSLVQVREEKSKSRFGLVIDGPSLASVMSSPDLKSNFLALAESCTSVICARTTPLQKQQVVRLVQSHHKDITTLAIGDGANDVSMIQAAHIGVGISGNEGMQAVMASDYAIAQFKFLKRLLLVHGRWSYKRISILVLYFFYKNIMVTMLMLWFQIFTYFSGQTFYDAIASLAYNLFFTSLPPIVVAVLDQDVPAKGIFKYPEMYREGQQDFSFNRYRFWRWVFLSIIASVWIFFIPMFVFNTPVSSDGQENGMWMQATVSYASLVFVVNFKIALETWYWTWVNHVAVWGSLVFFLIFFLTYNHPTVAINPYISPEMTWIIYRCLSSFAFYLVIFVVVFLCLLPDFVWKVVNRYFTPDPHHIVQERIQLFPEEFEENAGMELVSMKEQRKEKEIENDIIVYE